MYRLIDSGVCHPLRSVALEEAIVESCSRGLMPPTLHLYVRDRPTISLGYFEKVEEAVKIAALERENVFLVRRMSGGSSIYTDSGQLIFSLTIGQEAYGSPEDAYKMTCSALVSALMSMGIVAEHKPPNDVLCQGKKISGSAQTRKHGMLLVHGTVLVDTDLDRMVRVLRPRQDKRSRSRDEMTCITEVLGRKVQMNEVRSALVSAFSDVLKERLVPIPVNNRENERVDELIKEKYGKEEFILQF
ncbi:MAG: lipoate--protein ligase family protein [Methanomassiliicoccales archaeon]|nr:lipoate--protein ligase family protein [Methanomassiliicoccales archaeon]